MDTTPPDRFSQPSTTSAPYSASSHGSFQPGPGPGTGPRRPRHLAVPIFLGLNLLVFAGASQFMALNLLASGIGAGEIVLATLLMNFRHFLMSASLSAKIGGRARLLPVVAFGITDETFAVASSEKGELASDFLIGLESMAYFSWVSGTAVGLL